MIKEVVNLELELEAPEFKCDNCIADTITDPLPKTAFAAAFIGSAGSGKTSLMINMLTNPKMYLRAFDHVHLFAPPSSMGSLKDDIWENHPSDKIHNDLTWHALEEIYGKAKNRAAVKPKSETTLIIIDDMAVKLKEKMVEGKLREMIFNRRHNYTSVMILVQSYKAMSLDLRKTLSHFFMFKPRNKKEAESIFEELLFIPRETADEVMQHAFKDSHDFLMGDCVSGELYRNFNRLILPDEYGDDEDEQEHIEYERKDDGTNDNQTM